MPAMAVNYPSRTRIVHHSRLIRAYMLADNKLATKAGWDREALAIELQELQVTLPEIGLSLEITGFEPGEVDSIVLDFADEGGRAAARQTSCLSLGKMRYRKGPIFISSEDIASS